jgi:hypothetical protein
VRQDPARVNDGFLLLEKGPKSKSPLSHKNINTTTILCYDIHTKALKKRFEQKSFEQKSFSQKSFLQKSFKQKSIEQKSFEQNSFEQKSFEQKYFEQNFTDRFGNLDERALNSFSSLHSVPTS